MDYDKTDIVSDRTVQARLLDAAEELFCERGYEGVSVRDIASKAKCNVAAVNYYFDSKNNLYMEVWRRHLIPMRDARIASIEKVLSDSNGKLELEDVLRAFAETFVGPLVEANSFSRLSKLMARELIDRRLPAGMFMDEFISPTLAALSKALIETCPNLDEPEIFLITFSVVGQLMHLVHARTMFEQTGGNINIPMFDSNDAMEHIIKFSAAGIRAYLKEQKL